MKPAEPKPEIVYRIIDQKTGHPQESYSRAYCNEMDFGSVHEARHANAHGMFEDKEKYRIAKYKVTYTLVEEDCDKAIGHKNPSPTLAELYVKLAVKEAVDSFFKRKYVDGPLSKTKKKAKSK